MLVPCGLFKAIEASEYSEHLSFWIVNSLRRRYKNLFLQNRFGKGVIDIHLVAFYIPDGDDSEEEAKGIKLNGRYKRLVKVDALDLGEPSYNQSGFKLVK